MVRRQEDSRAAYELDRGIKASGTNIAFGIANAGCQIGAEILPVRIGLFFGSSGRTKNGKLAAVDNRYIKAMIDNL